MAASSPAVKARKCFAVAASTQHSGERDAAIARGMAIIEKHNLDPNDFDIPGRQRRRRSTGRAGGTFDMWGTRYIFDDLTEEAFERMAARMRESVRKANEEVYGRHAGPPENEQAEAAAEKLRVTGWRVEIDPRTIRTRTWKVFVGAVMFAGLSDRDLIRVARERADEIIREQVRPPQEAGR